MVHGTVYSTYEKAKGYDTYTDANCYTGHGGTSIDSDRTAPTGLTKEQCQARCDADTDCSCVTYQTRGAEAGKCWKRRQCTPTTFAKDPSKTFATFVSRERTAMQRGSCTVRKLDGESNTYIGITTHPDSPLGYFKYAEFQNECDSHMLNPTAPHCFSNLTTVELFDLKKDPHELLNLALTAKPALLAELKARLWRYYPCRGLSCP